ncbi:MAG: AAA family ATPase [Actinomycetota bacterium]|nr:AAA family ATPase [Actinomycetota bacterium]
MALCSQCGEENPDRARLCMMCGTALDAIPSPLAEERKVVSVLFVDLVGFTARSHDADPEDVRAALAPYHRLLKTEIERFGGTVEKFIGDAVMAVFGAPVAHEDDAERAVRAALRITEAIEELNQDTPQLDLSIRAAVNTGEGLVTLGARPQAGEGMVTGDVVNTASRLQGIAPVGGVAVGEVTYRSTKDFIDYEELEPVRVKGKPQPIPVWRAVAARSRFGVDIDMAPKTPFIGRDYEQTILKETFRRTLRESSIQLVTIVGEPGVGKSRLLSELSSFVDDREELIFWRQGRSLPYGEGITFWALGEIIKAHAGILESDGSNEAGDKLRSAVTAVIKDASEQQWFLSRLGPLVGVEVAGSASPQKEESFTAWRRFLEAIAEIGPLVLVFEDLHWADPSLLEFIEHLVDWVTGVPMFVVCTARPELYDKHPNWGGGKRNITVVSLSPLNDSETAQLISSLLSQAVLPAEIHATLLDRAGGNPLYAEEFIRMLWDRGILEQRGRVLSLAQDAAIPVPESVHALIAARLDTLSSERKSLLHDASVAGKVFWSGAVAAIGEGEAETIRQGLHELGGKELVRPARNSSMEGQHEYAFWHALIRDVCYGQIPRSARAKKHKAMADWIEGVAERLDDHAEVLAHHYSTALELARASGADDISELEGHTRRFLVAAGDRALKLDPAKALALYRQALQLLDPDDPDTPRVLLEAGRASRFLGLLSEAQDYFEQAIAGFSAQQDLSGEGAALMMLAFTLWDQGRREQARQLAGRAIELLEQEAPTEELSFAYVGLAFFVGAAGSLGDGLAWANKAIDVAHACGSNGALASALEVRGIARRESGDVGGLEDLGEALRLSEAAGDAERAALCCNDFADATLLIDGPDKALEINQRAQEIARTHGYLHNAMWAQTGALPMLFELGRWEELLDQADQVIAWSQDHSATVMGSWAKLDTARALFHRGRTHEALSLEGSWLALFREIDELESLAPSLALAALMHASTGDATTALTLVQEFERRTDGAPQYRARNLPDVVRALCAIGNGDQAQRLLLTESDVAFARDRHAVVTAHAIVAETKGDLDGALELHKEAAERWADYGFVLEEGQAHLGMARCLIALGNRPAATEPLQNARAVLTKLESRSLIDEVDRLKAETTALSS